MCIRTLLHMYVVTSYNATCIGDRFWSESKDGGCATRKSCANVLDKTLRNEKTFCKAVFQTLELWVKKYRMPMRYDALTNSATMARSNIFYLQFTQNFDASEIWSAVLSVRGKFRKSNYFYSQDCFTMRTPSSYNSIYISASERLYTFQP